jgi:hypothetical protein
MLTFFRSSRNKFPVSSLISVLAQTLDLRLSGRNFEVVLVCSTFLTLLREASTQTAQIPRNFNPDNIETDMNSQRNFKLRQHRYRETSTQIT